MKESFFKVVTPGEVLALFDRFGPVGEDVVPLEKALGCILSRDLTAPEDLPGFYRSAMDGYAVQAKATFGATESLPALVQICGEVRMGQAPEFKVGEGQAARISTGGMLPEGADSVVMVEYCHLIDEQTLEVSRAVSPLEHVIQPQDDFQAGRMVLRQGHRLRPQDVGVMAGLGVRECFVCRKPKVGIISSGDEVVPTAQKPGPGQVRDINRYSLGAFCRQNDADSAYYGLCPDRFEPLKNAVQQALRQTDTVWISGGSSVGTRDLTLQVLEALPDFQLLVHGISISPGKPTIIGLSGDKPIIGLPGHVTSALIIAEIFLKRLLRQLSGRSDPAKPFRGRLEAELNRNVESASGREDYIRVTLRKDGDRLIAEPIFGKSALISTLVEAHGLIRIPMNTEGLYKGQAVDVMLF